MICSWVGPFVLHERGMNTQFFTGLKTENKKSRCLAEGKKKFCTEFDPPTYGEFCVGDPGGKTISHAVTCFCKAKFGLSWPYFIPSSTGGV